LAGRWHEKQERQELLAQLQLTHADQANTEHALCHVSECLRSYLEAAGYKHVDVLIKDGTPEDFARLGEMTVELKKATADAMAGITKKLREVSANA